uniref:Transposase n=1 Tax=Romanomermis culicivorax TaxID=13658 RepID=A0A915IU31_ROMCU
MSNKSIKCRTLFNYSKDALDKAVEDYHQCGFLIGEAADHNKVPKRTLDRKLRGVKQGSHGRPPILTDKEEILLCDSVTELAKWGYLLTRWDLWHLVKNYLDNKGATIVCFKDNLPGEEWVACFLGRHEEKLAQRTANNIKWHQ